MKAIFKKIEKGIIPNCEKSEEMLSKINDFELVSVEYVKKRNYENHKRFFVFIDIAFDMQEFYEDKEQFRKAIQMIAGHYEALIIADKHGDTTTHFIPKSIKFDKMDEIEFKALFKRCITGFISRYAKGITEKELLRIIDFD